MSGYILFVPANTLMPMAVLPVATPVPLVDMWAEPYVEFEKIDVYTTGNGRPYHNSRGAMLLDAFGKKHRHPLYNDLLVTYKDGMPLSHREARLMYQFMDR